MNFKTIFKTLAPALLLLALAATAQAQATRTWVSGTGDDVNPCSRTAPCKTFAGAITKTAAGGEIDALDPGGFGSVTITKAITIDGGGNLASVLASGTVGVNVVAGANDVVTLRHLSMNGAGTTLGTNGISYTGGGALVIEDCLIQNFSQNAINVNLTAPGNLSVLRTSFINDAVGVRLTGTNPTLNASLRDVSIKGATQAINTLTGNLDVSHSVITQNSGVGLHASGGTITALGCTLTGNGIGVQADSGGTIRLSDNDIFNNTAAFGASANAFGNGGGTLASANNNRKTNGLPPPSMTPLTTF